MKTISDQTIGTTSANETNAASLPVNSPGMTQIEAVILLLFGDSPAYGGVFKLSGTFYTDADGVTSQVGASQQAVLRSETLRGLSTNLQVPRVWFGVSDPVDGAPGPVNVFVQGPRDTYVSWRVAAVAESL